MKFLRSLLVVALSIFLTIPAIPATGGTSLPLGILTIAERARLDESTAFPGLSVFEGERLSTGAEGRLGLRAGHSTLALGPKTEATLIKISDGIHVDMSAGSLFFSAAKDQRIEIHLEEATLWPEGKQPTQAWVAILSPRVLQITAHRGGLDFTYHQEFRNLPEGETYRIYLDAPSEPQSPAEVGSGGRKTGIASKVIYFIVGAGAGAGSAWVVHTAVSGSNPISPAKP